MWPCYSTEKMRKYRNTNRYFSPCHKTSSKHNYSTISIYKMILQRIETRSPQNPTARYWWANSATYLNKLTLNLVTVKRFKGFSAFFGEDKCHSFLQFAFLKKATNTVLQINSGKLDVSHNGKRAYVDRIFMPQPQLFIRRSQRMQPINCRL